MIQGRPRRRILSFGAVLALALVVGVSAAYAWAPTLTVNTQLTRTWSWDIEKSAHTQTVTLKPGETATVNYSVIVKTTGFTDSNWNIFGSAQFPAEPSVLMTDIRASVIDPNTGQPAIDGSETCPGGLPQLLTSSLTCQYSIDVPNANSGTVRVEGIGLENGNLVGAYDVQPFSFASATINEIDECVDVTDSLAGALGTVCAGDAPKTFTYSRTVGPFTSEQCGEHIVRNTASFVTNDRDLADSASADVKVTVVCEPPTGGEGCTPGYWKNHTEDWVGYTPGQTVGSVFANAGSLGSMTLAEALKTGGGDTLADAKRLLIHHAVAALLNSTHPDVDYAFTTAQVIAWTSDMLTSTDRDEILGLKDLFDTENNRGCTVR